MLALLRLWFRILGALSPRLAGAQVERLWFRITRPKISAEAQQFLSTGARSHIAVGNARVAVWRWGSGPKMLLMHGWSGYAAQLQPFVDTLVRAGREVILFDAPSHGASGAGPMGPKSATLFDFAESLVAVSGGGAVEGVIAHSGGCAATAWALVTTPSFRPKRIVFVAPFGHPRRYMDTFRDMLGVSEKAMDIFRANTEKRFGFEWSDFEVPEMAARVATPPLLVFHDKNDRETSWQDGADIAARWPNATLITTTGLGHNRILRDPAVVDQATRFILG